MNSRRMFLRGMGATLALPFLPSLAPSRALAQTKPQARFVFMGHYFGRDIDFWYPKQEPMLMSPEGVPYARLSDLSGEISHAFGSAFDPVRKKMSILRGLDSLDFDNGHTWSQPLTASGTDLVPSFGYSLDAILEDSTKFNPTLTKVGALRTAPATKAETHGISFSFSSKNSYGQTIPTQWSPKAVYDKYFNAAALQAAQGATNRKQTVSNLVMEDFKRVFNSSAIASDDKRRLDNYMTMLTSVERRLGLSIPACKSAAPADLTNNAGVHSAMIDLEVASLACGLTNVVVHAIGQTATDPSVSHEAHHAAAHQNGVRPSSTEMGVSEHASFDRWVMTRVAEMLQKLDAVDDGGGQTLLDNTFFLYANAESRGYHTFYDMPVMVAGGQGRLALGNYIDFRPRPLNVVQGDLIAGRPYNNLLITLFKSMGLAEDEYQRFGRVGFGTYANYARDLKDHYAPFLTLSQLNSALPFLYKG